MKISGSHALGQELVVRCYQAMCGHAGSSCQLKTAAADAELPKEALSNEGAGSCLTVSLYQWRPFSAGFFSVFHLDFLHSSLTVIIRQAPVAIIFQTHSRDEITYIQSGMKITKEFIFFTSLQWYFQEVNSD